MKAKSSNSIGFNKLVWLFFCGCTFGYVFECLFYVLKYGNFVNKQGLIIGPFKPIYGLSIIIATLLFSKLKLSKKWKIFIVSLLVGTIFEYLVSLFLEVVWNIYIWDYSSFNFNINGRVYVPYVIVWGILGVLWWSYGYPLFNKIYNKVNNRIFEIITVSLGVFFVIDGLLTFGVYYKISYNNDNIICNIVDKLFSEEEINSRFSKVRVINSKK